MPQRIKSNQPVGGAAFEMLLQSEGATHTHQESNVHKYQLLEFILAVTSRDKAVERVASFPTERQWNTKLGLLPQSAKSNVPAMAQHKCQARTQLPKQKKLSL